VTLTPALAGRGSLLTRVVGRVASPSGMWLAVRIFAWALWLPLLKRVLRLPTLVRLVRSDARRPRDQARVDQIVCFAWWSCRVTAGLGDGNCLERALMLYRFLAAASAHPSLVVGFARESDDLRGHAWVTVDEMPVGESVQSLAQFRRVLTFRPDGNSVAER
jgi:hypothetical protein